MAKLHHGHAKYDYYANLHFTDGYFEYQKGKWINSADFGNYIAGYGAGFGPPLIDTSEALIETHMAGGFYNMESDKGGLFSDSRRSSYFINQGFHDGLNDAISKRFVPYYFQPSELQH